jgi:hypothetical protein
MTEANLEIAATSIGTESIHASMWGATIHDPEQAAGEHDRLCSLDSGQLNFTVTSWILEIPNCACEQLHQRSLLSWYLLCIDQGAILRVECVAHEITAQAIIAESCSVSNGDLDFLKCLKHSRVVVPSEETSDRRSMQEWGATPGREEVRPSRKQPRRSDWLLFSPFDSGPPSHGFHCLAAV